MNNVYKCRICLRMYHDKEVVIDLSSEEAKKEEIAAKILSALSIMITDHDPIKHICRICYGQVEVNFRFATTCRINNAKYIETLSNAPSNNVVKTEFNKFMRIPVHALFNKYQFNVKGLFDAVTSFLNDPNENLSSTRYIDKFDQYFGLHNPNSISNQFDIENDTPIGIPESSSVLDVNMSSTNEPNVDNDDVIMDRIDLNNQSLKPIINTNNINHATNATIPRNILLNAQIPVMSSNNLSHTINASSGIFRIIPTVGTNNVNDVINNVNQSRINRPIICKNNVIKSTRFCILSRPQPSLMNGRHVETNNVQNLGSATHLNQSNVNSPSIVQSTINNHSDSVQSKGNRQINDDDVICLSDDDDDDDDDNDNNHNDNNNNGNGDNLSSLENSINPLNQWIIPSPLLSRNTNNDKNSKNKFTILYQNKNKKNAKQFITTQSAPSTIISSEEMTVTPDMPLSNSDEGSIVNQGEDVYFDVDNEQSESLVVVPETEPSRVLPDTGFHFLFSTDETVDLTTKEINAPKKKPITKQKYTPKPKKTVASKKQTQKTSVAQSNLKTKSQVIRSSTSSTIEKKQTRKTSIAQQNLKTKGQLLRSSTLPTTEQSDKSLTKARPKRASAIASAAEDRNSGLCKLGRHIERGEYKWTVPVINNISLPMFQCPICDVYLYSEESRKEHEVAKHSSLLETLDEPVDIAPTPGNTEPLTEKLTLFNYLQLCVTSKHKTKVVHQLARRKNLLRAFRTLGDDITGSFKCIYCTYTTNLIFALWAHMTTRHLYLKCEAEKKTCLYCFLCNRILTKRTTMLKHLDACINKKLNEEEPIPIKPTKQLKCVPCDICFESLMELEEHLWGHAKK